MGAKIIPMSAGVSPEIKESGEMTDRLAPVTPLHARGYSFEPLPDLQPGVDAAIDENYRKPVEAGKTSNVRWQIMEYRTESGTRFQAAHLDPLRRRTDIALTTGVCWGTQIAGYNFHRALTVAKLGMPVRIISSEINHSISLPESAFNELTFMQYDDMGENGFSEPDHAVLEGFSRHAMIAFGINSYASKFGRQIIYNDITDPCIAQHIFQWPLSDHLRMATYAPKEAIGIARVIGNILRDPRRRAHYVPTADLSPRGIAQFIRTGIPLFNGDAGRMAYFTPQDMHMHARFMHGSIPNQMSKFMAILEGRPNVVFDNKIGVHSDGAERMTIEQMAQRMSGLVIQLSYNVHPDEIDYDLVHQTARKAA